LLCKERMPAFSVSLQHILRLRFNVDGDGYH
jgi:hypothetical protein